MGRRKWFLPSADQPFSPMGLVPDVRRGAAEDKQAKAVLGEASRRDPAEPSLRRLRLDMSERCVRKTQPTRAQGARLADQSVPDTPRAHAVDSCPSVPLE